MLHTKSKNRPEGQIGILHIDQYLVIVRFKDNPDNTDLIIPDVFYRPIE